MKHLLLLIFFFVLSSCSSLTSKTSEKIYVVEREREAVSVIKDQALYRTITDLGNLNHATIKFKDGFAYALARDGYLSKIDTKKDVLVKKIKIAKSGIGITFIQNHLAVVNYDPHSVVILDQDLNIVKTIQTQSRNVGVKNWNQYLVFSLMDKNEIWVLNGNTNYDVIKKIQNVGALPFDALIKDHLYIVGLFNEGAVGVLDLRNFNYHKISVKDTQGKVVFKVPHFGYWGVLGDQAVVPLTGLKSLLVIDLKKMTGIKEVPLKGEPVFASISPDKKYLAINYSGEQEDFISVFSTSDWTKLKDLQAGRRVMHLRYSFLNDYLYVSSFFENQVHVFSTDTWEKLNSIPVSTPSGIFIEDERGDGNAR